MSMNNYIAGCASGIVISITGHPFDTLKTVTQSNNSKLISPKKWYRLYNGITFPLLGSAVIHSGCFGTNEVLHRKINNHYISGFLTGMLSISVITPIELYKVRAQNMLSLRVTPYKGAIPTLMRESIGASIYFGSYNQMREKNVHILLAGGLAGWFSWLASYPIDVCKTRIQSDIAGTFRDAFRMGNLWKGFGYCSIRCCIANSVGFYTYEKILGGLNSEVPIST